MAFRGLFFTEEHEHLDVFAVDLHETGPSGGDVHWRGAATGASRASFEGLIKIDPGAQQTHTYLQIHSMMLSPKAQASTRSRRCSSAPTTSRPRTAAPSASSTSTTIFYMQTRGLDRPAAVRVIVEGFFEPLIVAARRRAARGARARADRRRSSPRRAEDIEAYAQAS